MDYSQATTKELIIAGLGLFWHNLKNIIGLIAIQMITMSILLLFIVMILLNLMAESTPEQVGYGALLGVLVGIFICLSVCLVFPVAYLKKFMAAQSNETIATRVSLLHGLTYIKPLLIWFLIYFVIAGGLLLTLSLSQRSLLFFPLTIPGIIFLVSLCLSPFLIILEDQGPLQAIKQSHKMVWRQWWRTAGYLIVAGISVLLVFLAIALPFTFVFAILSAAIPLFIGALNIIYALILSALLPLFIALVYPCYLATKSHKQSIV